MNDIHADGYRGALTAAKEEFQLDMAQLQQSLANATCVEEEEAIDHQMREREAKHRDLIASLQRSLF
ncbi:hypothetical protein [Blastopirellula marina]|uniref:Uncharacterized protein n=1 Tax=Blastopirellula marina TaxID=124 RepID=A0A2S8FWP8_9BACT|nr:hypothetical protein [Blastopirellula marina]PQO36598.1 hypothetical protein C5Y98_11420 [Blastopirellula marina]PTL44428.1 hypothetical protein C5Y97_11430 [Blastopirellula marina]